MRDAAVGDLDALVSLEAVSFGTGPYRQHRFQRTQFRYYLDNPQAIVLVAVYRGQLAAYLLATVGRRSRSQTGRIVSIAVSTELRRHGIGSKLLRTGLRRLRQRGCRRVYLEVAKRARPARALFEAREFRSVRRLPDYYGHRVDGIRMRLDIASSGTQLTRRDPGKNWWAV